MEKIWLDHYNPGVPHEIDVPDIPLQQLLENSARDYADSTATVLLGAKLSYARIDELANRFANALQKLGVQKGDRVGFMLPNSPQFVIGYYGILKAGAVSVCFNPMYTPREIVHQAKDAGVKIMLILDRFFPQVKEAMSEAGIEKIIVTRIKEFLKFPLNVLEPVVSKRKGDYVEVPPAPYILNFMELLKSASPTAPKVEIDPAEDIALLQYTGGTTGVSKGAMLTHRNMVANASQARSWLPELKDGKEIVLSALPFFHVYGMTACMNLAVLLAATMIIVPDPRDMAMILKAAHKYRPTVYPGVPAMYIAITNHPDVKSGKYDVTSIQYCISGSAPMPVEAQLEFEKVTGARLTEAYGLTETSPATTINPLHGERKVGSIGIPFPSTEVKVVDTEDWQKEMPIGETGELAIKGPQVMKGYWNMPEDTAEVLHDGWLLTGDIAKQDEDGYFFIVDRKKDLIIAGGYNIYPRDVDEVLFEHPAVLEAAAVGVPDARRGETVKAFVALREGQSCTEQEIIEFCRERLAAYKVPTMVEFRSELPKTTIGKVLRRQLAEEERAKQAAQQG